MSAIIKGIKIPKYIGQHKEFDRYGGFLTVYKNGKVELHIFDTDYTIESIPTPHGRLIDADKLTKNMRNYYPSIDHLCCSQHVVIKGDIDNAPTVIEAEVSE